MSTAIFMFGLAIASVWVIILLDWLSRRQERRKREKTPLKSSRA